MLRVRRLFSVALALTARAVLGMRAAAPQRCGRGELQPRRFA